MLQLIIIASCAQNVGDTYEDFLEKVRSAI